MRRAIAAVPVVLLALACSPAHAAEGPLLPAPQIPPELQALETKADALQITSARVSFSTSLHLGHVSKVAREFARLLEFKIEGVETTLAAGRGADHDPLRHAGAAALRRRPRYLFSWEFGRHDGGRPWVELGHGPVGRLFDGAAQGPTETEHSGAQRWRSCSRSSTTASACTRSRRRRSTASRSPASRRKSNRRPGREAGRLGGALGGLSTRRGVPPRVAPRPTLTVYFAAGGASSACRSRRATGSPGTRHERHTRRSTSRTRSRRLRHRT